MWTQSIWLCWIILDLNQAKSHRWTRILSCVSLASQTTTNKNRARIRGMSTQVRPSRDHWAQERLPYRQHQGQQYYVWQTTPERRCQNSQFLWYCNYIFILTISLAYFCTPSFWRKLCRGSYLVGSRVKEISREQ